MVEIKRVQCILVQLNIFSVRPKTKNKTITQIIGKYLYH